jgi:hypothetical protein
VGEGVCHFEEGDFPYARFNLKQVEYNLKLRADYVLLRFCGEPPGRCTSRFRLHPEQVQVLIGVTADGMDQRISKTGSHIPRN